MLAALDIRKNYGFEDAKLLDSKLIKLYYIAMDIADDISEKDKRILKKHFERILVPTKYNHDFSPPKEQEDLDEYSLGILEYFWEIINNLMPNNGFEPE